MKKQYFIFFLLGLLALSKPASAQIDSTVKLANKRIVPPFVSDGQSHRAFLLPDQSAEFQLTLFAGTTYRISAACGNKDGNVIYNLYAYDPATGTRQQLIYSSSGHHAAPYWDFKVNATIDVVIEAKLNPAASLPSGFVVVAVGFKR
jgi:hypothetical protein